ncbi:hypothetical protein F5148DRAFT_1176969 [Russula earlei]|uniref:Uncharacterized protein n=1 Tax=Russula earlei TaxID=71964 RepID=A0ACC0UGR2_9AGAM|nr:hypothetical protein F5148DRAFT_1176969 [Russula earlei]
MPDSRVKLVDIPALTLYNDEPTLSRRGQPIPQLICKGKPCSLFKPDVIRCINLGGEGTNVDWKCETDLPESLRLGRVQVSCEGWSGPGDSYVLKGSCSLEYRLQEVPDVFKPSTNYIKPPVLLSTSGILFLCLCIGVLAYFLYKFLLPCHEGGRGTTRPWTLRPSPSTGSGWFPGSHDDYRRPPPPYSKFPDNTTGSPGGATSQARNIQDRLGFWSGAALGGLGTYVLTRQRNPEPQPRRYDWENERYVPRRDPDDQAPRASAAFSGQQSRGNSREGSSSNLGPMRRSTGFGGSTVR